VVAATLFASLGMAHGHAAEVTMKEYTDHLLAVFGEKGTVIAATVNGIDKDHVVKEDVFPSPDPSTPFYFAPIAPLSVSQQTTPCDTSQIIVKPTSGAYAFPWCAKIKVITPITYETQRDTFYYSGGRWTYVVSTFLDCQNASDLAQMPTAVQVAVCH
jgi:hypothetical protein